jgi:phosphohistidine phosphatase
MTTSSPKLRSGSCQTRSVEQRRLVLVRHAQAGEAATDRDRPLTEKGQRRAEAAGAWLAQLGVAPDRGVVSPALRALQTWDGVVAGLAAAPERVVDERIYDNTLEGLFEVLYEIEEDASTLILIGHNPAVGALAHVLDDGEGDETARGALAEGFPPGSVAVFDVGTPFAELDEGGATLVDLDTPSG